MDTGALKTYAIRTRKDLIAQVARRLEAVLDASSAARRESPAAVDALEREIAAEGEQEVIERVAYTWFNRFTALRYMDVCGYLSPMVVTPREGETRPEILSQAAEGVLPAYLRTEPAERVRALLEGRAPSREPQFEAYRALVVAACNDLHGVMPFLFEKIADYTELLMPNELLAADGWVAGLRAVMTPEACEDVEIIGWLYQFYISEKKDQVFAGLKKNQKIMAENIPAATQLFTPHWIVRYLVENSLGRLWLLNRPGSKLAERMDYYIAPEEPETDFLKIGKPEEIKVCDPACGSGHMLTYAFDLLYAIYEEEGYEADRIPALILQHNLTGVEIDDRAGALAAFALAMKAAARLGRRRFLRMAAKPDICVLQNVAFTPEDVRDVAAVVGKDLFTDELRETLGQFEQAKNFGSLIVPKLRDPAETLRVVEARDFGGDLLLKEVQERVLAVLRMAEALSPKYHVVVANPPYMGGTGMNGRLTDYVKERFPDSKADLMTCFMERSEQLTSAHGYWAMINIPTWMFLSTFEKLRHNILERQFIASLVHAGRGLFGPDFGAVAFVVCKTKPANLPKAVYRRLFEKQVDVRTPEVIENLFRDMNYRRYLARQDDFLSIPGAPIAYWISSGLRDVFKSAPRLETIIDARQGLSTSDNPRFIRQWWEVENSKRGTTGLQRENYADGELHWAPYNKGGEFRRWYGNLEHIIWWKNDGKQISDLKPKSVMRSQTHYFRESVSWLSYTVSRNSFRSYEPGYVFDTSAHSAFSENAENLTTALCFGNSKPFEIIATVINPTVNFHSGNFMDTPLVAIPKGHTERISVAATGLARSDWDAYETSWDFTTLPLLSPDHRAGTLEATYATLRAHWQSMTGEMQRLEEENNRIFIDAYDLQDELTPEVPIEEITLTCNPAYRYGVKGTEDDRETRLRADTMREFISYAIGCMFGRYSLDEPGLILANQGETLADYLAQVPEPSFLPDADNVIPIMGDDRFEDDAYPRFLAFLATTFGQDRLSENLAFMKEALGGQEVRSYLSRKFFADHVKRYKTRPIYWMISSPKGTFQALIYMHRYVPDTLNTVLTRYVRPLRAKLEAELHLAEAAQIDPDQSAGKRSKAIREQEKLRAQIAEITNWERDHLGPLALRRIAIDLDDGVKRNYPLFDGVLKPVKGLSNA